MPVYPLTIYFARGISVEKFHGVTVNCFLCPRFMTGVKQTYSRDYKIAIDTLTIGCQVHRVNSHRKSPLAYRIGMPKSCPILDLCLSFPFTSDDAVVVRYRRSKYKFGPFFASAKCNYRGTAFNRPSTPIDTYGSFRNEASQCLRCQSQQQ